MITFVARTLPIVNGDEMAALRQMTLKTDGGQNSVFNRLLVDLPAGTNALALVAENDLDEVNRWIGWSLLWWRPGDGSNLGVYVRPAWRRQGIARRLLLRQITVADNLGLVPYANATTEAAQELYRGCGVRPFTSEYK